MFYNGDEDENKTVLVFKYHEMKNRGMEVEPQTFLPLALYAHE
jgi:hypothetical protein